MALVANGTEIIFNSTSGRLIRYQEGIKQLYPEDSILFGEKLTNEFAIVAVRSGIRGVITKTSSFSTHGANILRGSKIKITWVTNVEIEKLYSLENQMVYINLKGQISNSPFHEIDIRHKLDNDIRYKFVKRPLNDTSIIDFDLINEKKWICYWKYNYFSKYIFSSLEMGIQIEFERMFKNRPKVKRTEDGKVWIQTDLLHSQILDYCNKPEWLASYLKIVHEKYNNIIIEMSSNCLSLIKLQKWLVEYYSCFTMIHRSYENVLYNFYEKVYLQFGGVIAVNLMDCFMFSKIDKWIIENNAQINNSKKFMIEEKIVPLPGFSIEEDIEEAQNKVKNYFDKLRLNKWYVQEKELIHSAIMLFVLKEWKFILYKLLTSRCYYYFSNRKNINEKEITEKTYDEVWKLYGDEEINITR